MQPMTDSPIQSPEQALRAAIAIVGSLDRVGRLYQPRITAQSVSEWRRCPAERVPALVAACGGKITPHELRPDLYAYGAETPATSDVA